MTSSTEPAPQEAHLSTTSRTDSVIEKLISRKLIVFLLGTGFFLAGLGLSADDWMTLAVAYIGSQSFVDAVVAVRNVRRQ